VDEICAALRRHLAAFITGNPFVIRAQAEGRNRLDDFCRQGGSACRACSVAHFRDKLANVMQRGGIRAWGALPEAVYQAWPLLGQFMLASASGSLETAHLIAALYDAPDHPPFQ
jgi:hypothetical protein